MAEKEKKGPAATVAGGMVTLCLVLLALLIGFAVAKEFVHEFFVGFTGFIREVNQGAAFTAASLTGSKMAFGMLGQSFFSIVLIIVIYVLLIAIVIKLFQYGMKSVRGE